MMMMIMMTVLLLPCLQLIKAWLFTYSWMHIIISSSLLFRSDFTAGSRHNHTSEFLNKAQMRLLFLLHIHWRSRTLTKSLISGTIFAFPFFHFVQPLPANPQLSHSHTHTHTDCELLGDEPHWLALKGQRQTLLVAFRLKWLHWMKCPHASMTNRKLNKTFRFFFLSQYLQKNIGSSKKKVASQFI